MANAPVSGACLCGAVRFEIDAPTLFCAHCHCSMCRRAHGAGYVTWIGVPHERFRMVAGEDRLVRYRSSDHGTRSFCGSCGSSLFCESTLHPDYLDIVLANLEGAVDVVPQAHFYFDDRALWVAVADDLPRFGGKTGTEPL
jgi:hypothetical protein